MSKLRGVWNLLRHFKYHLVIVGGIALTVFLDENSLLQRMKYEMTMNDLEAEIAKYDSQFRRDSVRLRELECAQGTIEKIARERYLMKTDNEDIFVLSDDETIER